MCKKRRERQIEICSIVVGGYIIGIKRFMFCTWVSGSE